MNVTNKAKSDTSADVTRTVWSKDSEFFSCDALDELLDMHDELAVGDVVFYGDVAPIPTERLCDADDVIDMIGDRAYDEVGEAADGYPDIAPEAKAELETLLSGWIEKHAKPTFYSVVNVSEHVITAADVEGRK
ncbi:gp45 [Burkholderia pseudomallei]|nr:gp45 [Burkholderia pseudomallei]